MHKILYRPLIMISLVLGMFVLTELLALGSITWRNLHRIDAIKQDIEQGHALEQLIFELLRLQIQPSAMDPMAASKQAQFHDKIVRFFANGQPGENGTGDLLGKVEKLFLNIEKGERQDLPQVLLLSENIFNLQRLNESKLLTQVYFDSKLELDFALVIPLLVFLPVLLFGLRFLRRQVLAPLQALEQLLSRLIQGELQPIAADSIEPFMQPVFTNYNRLVSRLSELELEHLTHTQTLEQEIRNATHTLLEQSHSLARAERLAAVGELAASAAHELRNPLAGIQAALENMRSDCRDADMTERLQLVSSETKRVTARLNDLLMHSKHQPESAKPVDIARLIEDLVTLLKYQVAENIRLVYASPALLKPVLPETEFRQALLNLLLNSIQVLGNQGGTVKLQIQCRQNQLQVEVSDSGPGFPAALLEQGIRPFASYREHGTGLGLSMVQRFARSLGGQLNLQNDAAGHARATLSLPVGV